MTQKKVIEIFGDDGQVNQYRALSDRLPEFLKEYGPEKGYQVVLKVTDAVTLQAGLAALYAEALKSSLNPRDMGLPDLVGGMVFRATLLNKDGKEIANATAHRHRVSAYKDFEKGETAARQRLLAALGFGGGIFDEDEVGDMTDQGLNLQAPHTSATPVPATTTKAPRVIGAAKTEEAATVPPPQAAVEEAPTSQPAQVQESEPNARAESIPPAILRQIEHQAKLKGKPVPTVTSLAEARAKLKELLAS